MDSKLKIGYAGTLMGYSPNNQTNNKFLNLLKDSLWEYKPKTCFEFTRSGYFLFEGIRLLKSRIPNLENFLQVEIWGNIHKKNETQVQEFEISEIVKISERSSKSDTLQKLKDMDILFLPLETKKGETPPLFTPGKLFEYMSFKKPILGLMGESEAKRILEESNLGIIVSPFSPIEIANKLQYLIKNKGDLDILFPPNEEYIDSFNFSSAAQKLVQIIKTI